MVTVELMVVIPAGPVVTNMAFVSASFLELGTAEKQTAIGCKADVRVKGVQRRGCKGAWARKWREEKQQGVRVAQRSGEKAMLRRRLSRTEKRLGVMGEGHGKLMGMALAAEVQLGQRKRERQCGQIDQLATALDALLPIMAEADAGVRAGEQMGSGSRVAVVDEDEKGWESVSSDENEVCEEYEGYGAGRSVSGDEGILIEECDDDSSEDEERAARGRRNEATMREVLREEREGERSGEGESVGDEDEGDGFWEGGVYEDELMEDMMAGWEMWMGEGGGWEQLQGRKVALCSFELNAMAFLQMEYEELKREFGRGRVRSRRWSERVRQWQGLAEEVEDRMEEYEGRLEACEWEEQMSRRRAARKERKEWLRGMREEEEAEWLRERQEEEEEKRKAHEEEMSRRPRMSAWLRRNEPEHAGEWEGLMEGERKRKERKRKESIVRGELEREERKRRVADFERRHKERISQVPDWQRRCWEKMERWLEQSRWEEGQKEVRQMRDEVKGLRVVSRVLGLELAVVEEAGRCVDSVSEGVQCGLGSVGWERSRRGTGARRIRCQKRRWGRQKKVWMWDGGSWEEKEWSWGEGEMRKEGGGLRRGLLFDGYGGYITCDVKEGGIEILG